MRKIFTSKKAIIAQALLVMAFAISGVDVIYGATTSTSSTDYINIKLTTSGSTAATMGSLSESTYVSTNNTAGSQTGTILLDNTTVVGHMHVNIGQTIDMYAPSADVDYTDKIGFSGNYTFTALGGKAGDITAKDNWAGKQSATGGYGSAITNSQIDYATGQSITYRKGSNGANVTAA